METRVPLRDGDERDADDPERRNPQIPKGDGDGPVQDDIAAMPGRRSDLGARLDALMD